MALITLQNADLAFGDNPLLDRADLVIEPRERVCLVGRNGAGKSTLLKVLCGEIQLDDGRIVKNNDVKIARLEQDPPQVEGVTAYEYVASGMEEVGKAVTEYHILSHELGDAPTDQQLKRLEQLQEQLDLHNGWQLDTKINQTLALLEIDPDIALDQLSGGWQRKVALAKAMVSEPDLLFLDEPTNHLDVATIEWLEQFLLNFAGSIVFISHDRAFIRRLATRIVDIDRGNLTSWPGDYELYLERKEEALRVEEEQNAEFDRRLAQEEVWIRQGIKARRTRNEGRVRALKAMRQERSQRINVMGKAKINVDEAVRSGKIVFEAEHLRYEFDQQPIVNDFSFTIQRGDKIALIGPNGCGKSTLLKIMLGELAVQGGKLKCGTKLEVAYFDQYRDKLDPEKSVMDNLAEGKQEVEVNGKMRHVLGYLQDFLFHPKRARTPVKALSGGEKNRLLLAKIFLKPSNLLILDEPTNDLDVETLELLEELLANYKGTLLLVSHDRYFVDNTATHSWVFKGEGEVETFVGGYSDARAILDQRVEQQKQLQPEVAKPTETVQVDKKPTPVKKNKLSYKLKLELEQLPSLLEDIESEMEALQAQVNDPEFFSRPSDETSTKLNKLAELEQQLETALERWEELEALQTGE
ncbi:ABC transporter ATP-binding protein [Motilimonas sp. KMU-193]|uniref:ATP-binding cassette ATPase Uup n=1 Tax=Motilimonas sp. KMU-193 TaxID=3388668 RepID=UPI00396B1C39